VSTIRQKAGKIPRKALHGGVKAVGMQGTSQRKRNQLGAEKERRSHHGLLQAKKRGGVLALRIPVVEAGWRLLSGRERVGPRSQIW